MRSIRHKPRFLFSQGFNAGKEAVEGREEREELRRHAGERHGRERVARPVAQVGGKALYRPHHLPEEEPDPEGQENRKNEERDDEVDRVSPGFLPDGGFSFRGDDVSSAHIHRQNEDAVVGSVNFERVVAVLQRMIKPKSQCAARAVKGLNEDVGSGGKTCSRVVLVDDVAVFEVLVVHVEGFEGISLLAEGNARASEDACHFLETIFLRFRGFKVGDCKDGG